MAILARWRYPRAGRGPPPPPAVPRPLTPEGGGEAEHIIAVQAAVAGPVAAHAGRQAQAAAAPPGQRDGVLHRGVLQPAGVAPVQALLPGPEQLREGGHRRPLGLAGLLRLLEVELVAPLGGLVGEHHTWGGREGGRVRGCMAAPSRAGGQTAALRTHLLCVKTATVTLSASWPT